MKVRPNGQVVTGQPTDLVWRVACPAMNRHEQYCLVALGEEEVFPVYIHLKRHEFQIID